MHVQCSVIDYNISTVTVLTTPLPPPPPPRYGPKDNHVNLMTIEDPLSDAVEAYWCVPIFEALVVGGSAGAVLVLLVNFFVQS